MKQANQMTAIVVLIFLALPLFAAEDDEKAFGQFQAILLGIDSVSFGPVGEAIDQTDLMNRVYSSQLIENDVKEMFASNFWQLVESTFMRRLPPPGSQIKGELVDFAFQDGIGRAALRFSLPEFTYGYLVFDLRHDSRGRLKIVDIFDTGSGQLFSEDLGEELITAMPTKEATRRLISADNPTDLELFEVTEILKASRDKQPPRFFEIYDKFSDQLKKEPFIAKQAVYMAASVQDLDRFVQTLDLYVEIYSDNANFALVTSDFYLIIEDYEQSFVFLKRFRENFAVKEGALAAKLSALALATGKAEDAEKFAVEATVDEPALELGWWSLLRARAAADNHDGALEALTYLEDNFSHHLDESKLRRDKFRAFTNLVASQEFKDWRAGRDGT